MLEGYSKVHVFGAGTFGQDVAKILTDFGIEVVNILDNHKEGRIGNWDLMHPLQADKSIPIVFGVCNLAVDLKLLKSELSKYGFSDFMSPVSLFNSLAKKGFERDHYWLTTRGEIYKENLSQINLFSSLLADEESKVLMQSLLAYRENGNIDDLPDVNPVSNQYLPFELNIVPQPMHLVDCGAFVGEFLDYAEGRNFSVDSFYAFEPDPDNFEKLVLRMERMPSNSRGIALPMGVAETAKQVRFSADGSLGAAIDVNGNTVIQVVSIDESLKNIPINYIKMDIEGAEMDALKGAVKTISSTKANLAISAYHKPEDLWEIGLWLNGLDLGYQFVLRQYGHQCFDTVLYAFQGE